MKQKRWTAILLAVSLAAAMTGCAPRVESCPAANQTQPGAAYETLAEATYPEMAKYPDETAYMKKDGSFDDEGFSKVYDAWWADKRARRDIDIDRENVQSFVRASTGAMLESGNGGNFVYSPLNVYMALSMLAECTDGDSRTQILSLLRENRLEDVRAQAKALWNANYCADGAVTSVLASSVWLDEGVGYVQKTLDTLAQDYYASSFSGEMGSDSYNKALQSWLNEQTGGMLNDAVSDVAPDASTLMALYSTVWFKGRWDNEFNKQLNDTRTFHAPSGDVQAEFMNQSFDRSYYWGEDFGAVKQPFVSGCDMWLILPDEDKSVSDVLDSGNYLSLLTDGYDYENSRTMKVNLALPKFDVTSTIDLREGLTELGITDVFSENADFSELCSSELYVNSARQSARVTIDEEGCTAAAFTEMVLCGSACPPANIQEIDFVLDRPFLFVITGLDGQPLFVGTVFNV